MVAFFLCPQPRSLSKVGKFSICIVNLAQGEKPSKQDSAALFLSPTSSNPRLESSLLAEGHFCYSNNFFDEFEDIIFPAVHRVIKQ